MDSDKLFIPDKWIHQFVLRTRQYLFSDEPQGRSDREGSATSADGAVQEAGVETGPYEG